MTKLYKLTTQDGYTRKGEYNQCLWGVGVTHSGTGKGDLCGPGYIHAYTSPILAILLNPIHADLTNPKLWEAEGEVVKDDNGLKVGCVSLTVNLELKLPEISIRQRVIFAILCARAVGFVNKVWDIWADGYIKNDVSKADAARSAVDAVHAARAAAAAYAADAVHAARSAVDAARAAAYAADAVHAARSAAAAAAYAIDAAGINTTHNTFNLISIAERAIKLGAE